MLGRMKHGITALIATVLLLSGLLYEFSGRTYGQAGSQTGVFPGPGSGAGGAVSSVFGRTGAVVAATNDYSFAQISSSLAHSQLPTLLSGDIPNNAANTIGNAATATALATTPTKCSAGNYPLGVDVSGNAQNCTAAPSGSPAIEAYAGDGSDGAVTVDGTTTLTCLGAPAATVYTLTRDCMFTTFVQNNGSTIKTANYRLLANVSWLNHGVVSNNGTNGGNGGNAAGATGGTAGTAGAVLAVGTLTAVITGKAGVAGATGVTTAAAGAAGTAAIAGATGTNPLNGTATASTVAGGAGGASVGGANAGGAGGALGSSGATVVLKFPPRVPSRAEYLVIPAGTGYSPASTIAGSGSGGAGAGDGTNAGGGGGGSGGNGAPGGLMVIISPTITNAVDGLITATGGNGGNGGNGAAGVGGNAGGGGGGSGGEPGSGGGIALIYSTLTETTAVTAASGTGGSAGALGAGVGTGSNGVAGSAGVGSLAGTIWRVSLP